MNIRPAQRIENLPPYLFAEIDRKIAAASHRGTDIIKLGIGDPDRPTPDYIVRQMQREVGRPANHSYPPAEGLTALKNAVAAYYLRRYRVELDPQQEIAILIGSKEGISHISACFTDPGDINLVPDPGYPVYGIGTMLAGGQPVAMPLLAENSYLPDLSAIDGDIAKRAKIMFLNYPNNPTGAVASTDFFAQAAAFARKNNVLICQDMAYGEIAYDGYSPPSILEVPGAKDCCIEFGSLSKTFNMTGWRIGYAAGCPQAVEVLTRYKTNIDSGAFQAVQFAAVEALSAPEAENHIQAMGKVYTERRNLVVTALNKMGIQVQAPRASFYVWAPVPKGFASSAEFVGALLDKTGVVVTPGRGFGQYGENYFRIALTVEADRLDQAMGRMQAFLQGAEKAEIA